MFVMLAWKTIPQTQVEATKKFLSHGIGTASGVTIKSSYHGVGVGFVLVEADTFDPIYALCAAWGPLLTIEAHPVIQDELAKPMLEKLIAA